MSVLWLFKFVCTQNLRFGFVQLLQYPRHLRHLTWIGEPYGDSAFSLLWVATVGLLELMSTGELISSACRSAGAWTMRLRVFRAVVMENCRRLFRLESGTLEKAVGSVPLALGDAVRRDVLLNCGDQWLLLLCRSCLAVVFGCKRQRGARWHVLEIPSGTAWRLLAFPFFLSFPIWPGFR